jgi:hypothetical protein
MLLLLAPLLALTAPTFNKDVAPILYKNCATCHRPGEVAPFSLLTYSDAKRWAPMIAQTTGSHIMPPWKAASEFGDFADARVLTAQQIATLKEWSDAGAPEGNPRDKPTAPRFPEGWQLGTPDLILEMPAPFAVPAEGRDIQQCFSVPLDLKEDMRIAGVEVRPGNRRVLHHTVVFIDILRQGQARVAADPSGTSYPCFGGPGVATTGLIAGWAPGNATKRLPEGVAVVTPKGADLVIQNHYHPDGKPETDKTTLGIYLQKGPVVKQVIGLPLLQPRLRIPAGDSRFKAAVSFTTPLDLEIAQVMPHMHLLGREMKVTATLPSGEVKPLVWIKDWDFNWQLAYEFKQPMLFPAGTKFDLEAFYDNSQANPHNPNSPPKEVHFGESTTDEMCVAMLVAYTPQPSDQMTLGFELVKQLRLKISDLMGQRPGVK